MLSVDLERNRAEVGLEIFFKALVREAFRASSRRFPIFLVRRLGDSPSRNSPWDRPR